MRTFHCVSKPWCYTVHMAIQNCLFIYLFIQVFEDSPKANMEAYLGGFLWIGETTTENKKKEEEEERYLNQRIEEKLFALFWFTWTPNGLIAL